MFAWPAGLRSTKLGGPVTDMSRSWKLLSGTGTGGALDATPGFDLATSAISRADDGPRALVSLVLRASCCGVSASFRLAAAALSLPDDFGNSGNAIGSGRLLARRRRWIMSSSAPHNKPQFVCQVKPFGGGMAGYPRSRLLQ